MLLTFPPPLPLPLLSTLPCDKDDDTDDIRNEEVTRIVEEVDRCCGDDEFDMRDVLLLDCTALRIREAAEDMGIILLFFLFPSFLSFFGLTTSIFHCERRWERSMRLWYLGKKKERERDRERVKEDGTERKKQRKKKEDMS